MKGVITHMPDFQFDLKHIGELAPFLDSDTLLMMVEHINSGKLNKEVLGAIAPFLKSDDLDRFASGDRRVLSTDYLAELALFCGARR
jgi:hypothetical protein